MKYIVFIILLLAGISSINVSAQSARWQTKKYIVDKDSVIVDHQAIFCKHQYYDQKKEEDAVKFTLTIKNNSSHLIPDIQTARYNQPEGLKIYINGYDAMQMSLANGMFGGDIHLVIGDSDSWSIDQQITGPHALDYGDLFTWQWEYMGIKSPIMQVDVKNRTIKVVKEHVKSDKVIY